MERKVVLLVEDSSDTRDIYRTVLAQAGYVVLEAADGEEGLALACERRPVAWLAQQHRGVHDQHCG